MRRETTPEDEMRWELNEVLQDAHLDLTPYEDSIWEIRDRKNDLVYTSSLAFVVRRKGDSQ